MTPVPYRVADRRDETADTVTLVLEPAGAPIPEPAPGQFTMMYAFGVGEVPISVSRTGRVLEQTVRAVGPVTRALCATRPGQVLGLRGPFGSGWGLEKARGRDLVFAAGGIGLAPLRPAVLRALEDRGAFGRIAVLIGARTPADLPYTGELVAWRRRGAQVEATVDQPAPGWTGHVGLITALIGAAGVDPRGAAASPTAARTSPALWPATPSTASGSPRSPGRRRTGRASARCAATRSAASSSVPSRSFTPRTRRCGSSTATSRRPGRPCRSSPVRAPGTASPRPRGASSTTATSSARTG
ncbi:hypothetical protein ACFQ11_02335 [Actinomadura sediminis]|uniref:FAD-binding FR-type domain-containing protein n=1 Tax=Actinomadura sediminis TaxID=1038904 RepID=A0ABW3EK16_9ACTN